MDWELMLGAVTGLLCGIVAGLVIETLATLEASWRIKRDGLTIGAVNHRTRAALDGQGQ